mgnify:CR=1 FL=1
MEKITLQNEAYFALNPTTNNIEMMGELTGDYVLFKNINSEEFQVVFVPDNNEIFLISRPI